MSVFGNPVGKMKKFVKGVMNKLSIKAKKSMKKQPKKGDVSIGMAISAKRKRKAMLDKANK